MLYLSKKKVGVTEHLIKRSVVFTDLTHIFTFCNKLYAKMMLNLCCICAVLKHSPVVTTLEDRADMIQYRPKRFAQAVECWQEVPLLWDRVQSRQMIDTIVTDRELPISVHRSEPTLFVHLYVLWFNLARFLTDNFFL